jgi:trigger factor
VKTSVERVDDTTVKLSITVEAARVDAAIDAAARELGAQVRVPGFRPGRVPRRVLETRLGKGALLEEAARDSLPQFYSEAIESEDIPVVAAPQLDVETFEGGQDAEFTATVEVRPDVPLPAYEGLEVESPEWEVSDEDLAHALDTLRERFAEVDTVSRPAQAGDLVVLTITGERNGRRVDEASMEDTLYEVQDPQASGQELDRQLAGASAGAILKFRDTLGADYGEELAGQELSFTAIVKEVKTKRLPDLDDDFAITASEFDTLDELRDDLRATLGRQKRAFARQALRGRVVEAVTDLVEVPLPPSMVAAEQRFRLSRLASEAERYGMTLEQYLSAAGEEAEAFVAGLEDEAKATVKAQLVVDRVGQELGIDVSQQDLGEEIGRQSVRLGRPPEELARLMTSSPERIGALVADAFRRKTIDAIVAAVRVTNPPPQEEDEEGELEYAGDDPAEVEGHEASALLEAEAEETPESDELPA